MEAILTAQSAGEIASKLLTEIKAPATKATPKTTVSRRLIKGIKPNAQVLQVAKEWQEKGRLIAGCDLVFGCVDTYIAREQIERVCRRFMIPFIDIGMDVTELADGYLISGQMILSMPNEPCMRCFGFLNEEVLAQEAARYGAAGGRPQVIWPNGILASAAVGRIPEACYAATCTKRCRPSVVDPPSESYGHVTPAWTITALSAKVE